MINYPGKNPKTIDFIPIVNTHLTQLNAEILHQDDRDIKQKRETQAPYNFKEAERFVQTDFGSAVVDEEGDDLAAQLFNNISMNQTPVVDP